MIPLTEQELKDYYAYIKAFQDTKPVEGRYPLSPWIWAGLIKAGCDVTELWGDPLTVTTFVKGKSIEEDVHLTDVII